MKTPLYETSTGALQALLLTRSFGYFDLYTITTRQGLVLHYSTGDKSVAVSGTVWSAGSALFDTTANPSKVHYKAGVDVDTWTVHVAPRAIDPLTGAAWPDTINGTPFLAAVRGGALDMASVQVDRAYFNAATLLSSGASMTLSPVGVITVFAGQVAEVDVSTAKAVINVNSWMDILTQQLPRNVYAPACRYTLFGSGCGLSAGSYQQSATITAASSNASLTVSVGSPGGSGVYDNGRIQITSGANAGFWRQVRSYSGGVARLLSPFPSPVSAGTTALMYPGCAKTTSSCNAFGNLANFGGQPYIPQQETPYAG